MTSDRTPEDKHCQFCCEPKLLERCYENTRADGKPIMACYDCHKITCPFDGGCAPNVPSGLKDELQFLAWRLEKEEISVASAISEAHKLGMAAGCKAQATALLEKGPKGMFDIHHPYPNNEMFVAGFDSCNAKWRSVIKEYLGGLDEGN